MFGTIFTCLTAVLILYYAVLVCMDLFIKPTGAADESGTPDEAEIDISDEANSFTAIEIKRGQQSAKKPVKAPVEKPTLSKPLMTNYLPVEQLARKARNITSSEDASLAGLGEIIIKCESAA